MTLVLVVLAVLTLGLGIAFGAPLIAHASGWEIVLLILVGLILTALVTAVAFYKTAKRNIKHRLDVEVEIHGEWRRRVVYLHFYHWLPKFFRAFDVTLDNHLWFRGGPPARTPPLQGWKPGGETTHRWMVGHALSHYADQEREDHAGQDTWLSDVVYYLKSGWHRLFHAWSTREEEIRANIRQASIADGASPIIRAVRLASWFPDNVARP